VKAEEDELIIIDMILSKSTEQGRAILFHRDKTDKSVYTRGYG
jgi:Ni,Fe-hydrogenase maturation factor